MLCYDEIFTFENLYRAHIITRRSKRHKKDVILFELDLGNNIWKLKKELDSKTYNVKSYNCFIIHEPKKRIIQAMKYEDRVVQHCLVDTYLMPLLERYLIYDNGACRVGKGTDFCLKRVRSFLTKYYRKYKNNGYVLQFDIHHYFESIKHDVLIEKIKRIITDNDVLDLLIKIIKSYEDYDNSGLPIGNQTSQCFALYYLDEVDRLIKEKYSIKYYSRYMDDGIIICDDKEKLQIILLEIKALLSELGITLNLKKSRIFKLKEGFTYLGFRFLLLETGKIVMKLPNAKKARIRRYLKSLDDDVRKERLVFYKNYLLKGNNYNLLKGIVEKYEK